MGQLQKEEKRLFAGWPRNLLNDIAIASETDMFEELPEDIIETILLIAGILSGREQEIASLLYVYNLPINEVADKIHYSVAGVRLARARIVNKLAPYHTIMRKGRKRYEAEHCLPPELQSGKPNTLYQIVSDENAKTDWMQDIFMAAIGNRIEPLPCDTEETIKLIVTKEEYQVLRCSYFYRLSITQTSKQIRKNRESVRLDKVHSLHKISACQNILHMGRENYISQYAPYFTDGYTEMTGSSSIDGLLLNPSAVMPLHSAGIHTIYELVDYGDVSSIPQIGKIKLEEIQRALNVYNISLAIPQLVS